MDNISSSGSLIDNNNDINYDEKIDNNNPNDVSDDSDDYDVELFNTEEDLFVKIQEDKIVKEALAKGIEFKNYSSQIENELFNAEKDCINSYLAQSEPVSNLYNQIKICDNILIKMQSLLIHFKSDLGVISSKIKNLQNNSMSMSIKLKNSTNAEQILNKFVSKVSMNKEFINKITVGELDMIYIDYLKELSNKLQALHDPFVAVSKAAKEVAPILIKLRLKAIQRIRDYFLIKFHTLKKSKTNIQMKQNLLLKHQYFYQFLMKKVKIYKLLYLIK